MSCGSVSLQAKPGAASPNSSGRDSLSPKELKLDFMNTGTKSVSRRSCNRRTLGDGLLGVAWPPGRRIALEEWICR